MPRATPLTRPAARRLRPLLLALEDTLDRAARIAADPLEFPRRYADPADAEVAGLVASALAYGRADLFRPQVAYLLGEMGPRPADFAERFARAPSADRFPAFRYRFNRPPDAAALVAAAGALRLAHGSLGARFGALYRAAAGGGAASPVRAALAAFAAELRAAPPAVALLEARGPRGLAHLLPDAAKAGACKRWNLYLRWMVRGPDGVDLGHWRAEVPAAALVVPLDTHLARMARQLGLTRRRDLSWRTAEEVTAGLRLLDPEDPVRHDFALCHLGMSGACPARRGPEHCAACALTSACRERARPGSARARTASPAPRRGAR
ncbi:TIGR02757 family protein [Anaeromyxobacter paludicola]|uniref:TIGR02757 family protein n=1 Tax=Anaeromyxobacter paludicola TaxID=2918171 RepID=A0ABM7X5E9_9BACT|nr:TIGR02757 family protein [Anaeromyxobacter paludicola]BDG07045.1 TIGR02757 family protein [Anaeromyxobacter paludicola]